jgi:hypothetical protein
LSINLELESGVRLLTWALACSKDDVTGIGEGEPDPQIAASLAKSSRTAAMVEENLTQVNLFQNPMTSIAGDAGLYEETNLGGRISGGVSFPENSARIAAGVRALRGLNKYNVEVMAKKSPAMSRIAASSGIEGSALAPGDTIAVEYFDGPDSTGLNALIEGDEINMVRYVSLREYPRILGHVIRRDQEIVINTRGTLEDDSVRRRESSRRYGNQRQFQRKQWRVFCSDHIPPRP